MCTWKEYIPVCKAGGTESERDKSLAIHCAWHTDHKKEGVLNTHTVNGAPFGLRRDRKDTHNSYKGIMNWLDLPLLTFKALCEYRKLSKSLEQSSRSRQITHNHSSLASWAFPLILRGKLPEYDICLRALERKHEISALFISHSQTVTSAIRAPQLGSSRRESSAIMQKCIRRCESVFEGKILIV